MRDTVHRHRSHQKHTHTHTCTHKHISFVSVYVYLIPHPTITLQEQVTQNVRSAHNQQMMRWGILFTDTEMLVVVSEHKIKGSGFGVMGWGQKKHFYAVNKKTKHQNHEHTLTKKKEIKEKLGNGKSTSLKWKKKQKTLKSWVHSHWKKKKK